MINLLGSKPSMLTHRSRAKASRAPAAAKETAELVIEPARIARWALVVCVIAEIAFVVLDYHVNYGKLVEIGAVRRLSNIAREDGLASWFGTAQTLLVAVTLWFLYALARHRSGPRFTTIGWLTLALFFSYMTIDDGAQLHERLGTAFQVMRRSEGDTLAFFPSYTWQLVFLPVFGSVGLFMAVFLWRELPSMRERLLVGAAIGCMVLAVGLDFVEGLAPEHRFNLYSWAAGRFELEPWAMQRFGKPAFDALRHFSKSLEEAIEMLAITLLWFVFLRHTSRVASGLGMRLGASRS